MKCSLCGSDFSDGMQNCPVCGNFVGRSDRAQQNAAPMYTAQSGFVPNYPNYAPIAQSGKKKTSVIYKIFMGVLIAFVAFVALCVVAALISNRTKEYDFKTFTIELPAKMEKKSNSRFKDDYEKLGASSVEVYENGRVRFAYVYFDSNSENKPAFSFLTPELLIESMSSGLKDDKGYLELEKSKDTLKYNVLNDDNKMTYCELKVISEDDGLYALFLVCNEDNQSRYEEKFDEWLNTFKTK